MGYILGIDQSTQGTKAILADGNGKIIGRADAVHRQIVNEKGWISHDLEEIYQNVIQVSKAVIEKTGICKGEIEAIGISNQRETAALWNRAGKPLNLAVVWQCARAAGIAKELEPFAGDIRKKTGLTLSAYFPAAKMAWLLQNTDEVKSLPSGELCLGTIDSWLVYRLTGGRSFKTDYSNASRTQLLDIRRLVWDKELCRLFGIPMEALPEVCDSNSDFGSTDLDGILERKIPIRSVLGDSHAALFGQGCLEPGMTKTTYGTGSSIMMNTGDDCIASHHGLVASLAWGIDGKVTYVLEGNINYTGAVLTWLKDDVMLISSPAETCEAAKAANPQDETVLVPAFSGLSAPYWKDDAKAMLYGMSRKTGRNEIIKAALDSIALQIGAVLEAMEKDSGTKIRELRVDGGPTRNEYLMQIQSSLSDVRVAISDVEELSALGAAYLAGISAGIYQKQRLFENRGRTYFVPEMKKNRREEIWKRWEEAVSLVINQKPEAGKETL